MTKKKAILVFMVCFVFITSFTTIASADTVLFPVIAVNQPNVTTIVSVYNLDTSVTNLHYVYRFKDSLVGGVPNISGPCSTFEFTRATKPNDVVSFDTSGVFNSGNALFGDTDIYGGPFSLTGSGARRAYLLVTHSDSIGNRVETGSILGGEAVILDIAFGAAWGYRAVNDIAATDYTFINYNDRGSIGVYSSISDSMWIFSARLFSFFPPSEWKTRFFVTPIGGDMRSDKTAIVGLSNTIYNRTGSTLTGGTVTKSVTCTAGIDLQDLIDSTLWSSIENTGGWTLFFPTDGDVIAYKLEYVVDDSTYGGTNNNGYLLSTYDFP